MSNPAPRPRATIGDLLSIPENERYHELIDGELVRKADPSFEHGDAQGTISHLLFPFRRRGGGSGRGGWWFASEVDVLLGNELCRPDVAGWRRDRVPQRPKGSPVEAVPDFVCEILSASNKRMDVIKKKHILSSTPCGALLARRSRGRDSGR